MLTSDKEIYNIFVQIFNGHEDISNLIINYKNDMILEEIKTEYIERDFHHWLNYDLPLRSFLGQIVLKYFSMNENDKVDLIIEFVSNFKYNGYLLNDIYNYYDDISDELGLSPLYYRQKSLTDCFNSKWWKTTEKNSISWKDIHFDIQNYIYFKI